MITENSFFKRIPAAIQLEQRLIWEGAGWAIEAISWSFEKLKSAVLQINDGSVVPTEITREVVASCWSVIDQCHMLREILKRIPPSEGGPTDIFIKKFEAVTLIRSSMDHLHVNIKNIANDKAARPPLFGSLSFCAVRDRHLAPGSDAEPVLKGCVIITLMAGALTHPETRFRGTNPLGRLMEIPVGLFQFQAFKHIVNFSELVNDLAALVRHFDTVVKDHQELELRKFARENGLDEDKVATEHLVSNLVTFVEWNSSKARCN